MDRRGVFEIVPSQHADIRARYPWIPDRAYAEALQLVRDSDGRTWQGAAAVEEVIAELRAGWILSWVFHIPFARPIAERLYGWFARHRNRLGCGEHCTVAPVVESNALAGDIELGRQESNLQLPE